MPLAVPLGYDSSMLPSVADAPRRILIYGVTGSGKSTLAVRLSKLTGIPYYSVDDRAWEPGWVEVPAERQREIFAAICREPSWILDTAYAKWVDIPLASADLIVALDYPRWLSLWRLSKRTFLRLLDQRPICNGNRESFKTLFSKDSIILWHFASFSSKRNRIDEWCHSEGLPIIWRSRSTRQTEALIQKLSSYLDNS